MSSKSSPARHAPGERRDRRISLRGRRAQLHPRSSLAPERNGHSCLVGRRGGDGPYGVPGPRAIEIMAATFPGFSTARSPGEDTTINGTKKCIEDAKEARMRSKMTHRLMMSIVAVLALAPAAFGQAPAAPRRSIEHMNGGVYRAIEQQPPHGVPGHDRRHRSGGPDQRRLRTMAQGGVRDPLQGSGQIRHLQPPPLGPCLGRGCLCRHGQVRRP